MIPDAWEKFIILIMSIVLFVKTETECDALPNPRYQTGRLAVQDCLGRKLKIINYQTHKEKETSIAAGLTNNG